MNEKDRILEGISESFKELWKIVPYLIFALSLSWFPSVSLSQTVEEVNDLMGQYQKNLDMDAYKANVKETVDKSKFDYSKKIKLWKTLSWQMRRLHVMELIFIELNAQYLLMMLKKETSGDLLKR